MAEIDVLTLGAAKSYTDKHGGGGGTFNYNALENKPQIGGNELVGNKTASDLGLVAAENGKSLSTNDYDNAEKQKNADNATAVSAIKGDIAPNFNATASYAVDDYVLKDGVLYKCTTAHTGAWDANDFTATTISDEITDVADAVDDIKDGTEIDSFGDVETALAGKQGTITAGLYIQKSGDTISVKRDISQEVDEVLTLTHDTSSGTHKVNAVLTVGGEIIDSDTFTTDGGTFHDMVQISFNTRAVRFMFKYLVASKTESAGYENYIYNEYTDTFVETIGEESKLIIKSELDDAMSTKQNTLTFDDVPTANSNNPVKSGGVKSAIDAAVASAYHHAGTKTCVELVAGLLVAANEGNVYNMTDSGTTTADFIEGQGQPIKAGDNVGIAKISDGVYKFDLLSGFVDTSNFVQKSVTAGLLKNDGTVDTTIQGDVGQLKSGLTNLSEEVNGDATTYQYADVITIDNAVPSNLADCSVKIEPVQDLHGYDKPWVGGADKNIIPMTVAGIKASNTTGTWTGNVYALNGVTFEILTDNDNNVIGGKLNGTNNSGSGFDIVLYRGNLSSIMSIGETYTITDCSVSDYRTHNYSGTFTVDSDWNITDSMFKIWVGNSTTFNNEIRHPQLEVGNQATTFAPYTNLCPISGHTEVDVQRDGRNIWDEQLVIGDIDGNTGEDKVSSNYFRSTYVPISPQTVYYMRTPTTIRNWLYFYDANMQYLGFITYIRDETNKTFTSPANAYYMRFLLNINDYGRSTYNNDVCLNVSDESFNGQYVPYAGKTYTIALGDTIYGGTVRIDSNGNTVMDVDSGILDLGSLTYTYESQYARFTSDIVSAMKAGEPRTLPLTCECYEVIDDGRPIQNVSDSSIYNRGGSGGVHIQDSRYTDPSDFATALDGMQLVYPLATPTTIQLTPQQIQLLKGTNTITASTGQIRVTVNGVSGSIGQVQEQVNEIAEDVENITSVRSATAGTNVTIDGGGYITVGNMVIVNIEFTANDNIASNTVLLNLPNELLTNTPINIYDKSTYDMLSKGRIYNGKLMASEQVASSNSYYVAGVYIKS